MPKESYDVRGIIAKELPVLNSIYNGIIAVDHKGRVVVYNKGCEGIFKVPAEKALGSYIKDVIPYTGLLKVLKTGKSHIGRKFVQGNSLYVVNRTPIIKDNVLIGAVGVTQDITELQTVVNELDSAKEMKNTLETILDTAHDGYLVINKDGYIMTLNGAFAELLEIRPEDAIGKHVKEVVAETELHLVPHTGKAQIGEVLRLKGREAVVMRYPVKKEGRIIGAVSKVMFKDVKQFISSAKKIYSMQSQIIANPENIDGVRYTVDSLIGDSLPMRRLKSTIRRIAAGPSTILIRGESGTGKELVAHAIHINSNRSLGPFVKVNCAAVPENLLESELFGYVEGAFTGAKKGGQIGKFERANGGTIFLDEIGDMPLVMQAKLLRVLQEKEIERLGDSRPRRVDVRVVAATNRPLEELIKENNFREDLYYRLNVVTLNLPPLRERIEDIRDLTQHFLAKYKFEFGLNITGLSSEAWNIFESYNWPGNVRELENVIERAFNMVDGQIIDVVHLPPYLQKFGKTKRRSLHKNLPSLLEQVERDAIIEALSATDGNKMQAAKILGISRAWLYKKIAQYNIKA
nr:sigma 54-interacting transcriptional regulator [Desulfolucanica intricata]